MSDLTSHQLRDQMDAVGASAPARLEYAMCNETNFLIAPSGAETLARQSIDYMRRIEKKVHG